MPKQPVAKSTPLLTDDQLAALRTLMPQAFTEGKIDPETGPLDYAATQNNLGIAYGNLADHQDPAGNLGRAFQAFNEALRFYTPETAPRYREIALKNLEKAQIKAKELEREEGE